MKTDIVKLLTKIDNKSPFKDEHCIYCGGSEKSKHYPKCLYTDVQRIINKYNVYNIILPPTKIWIEEVAEVSETDYNKLGTKLPKDYKESIDINKPKMKKGYSDPSPMNPPKYKKVKD